jgi:hypothetical protein
MAEQQARNDLDSEQKIREALAMKGAFGADVARTFLKLRGVDPAVTERVLSAPKEQLRN